MTPKLQTNGTYGKYMAQSSKFIVYVCLQENQAWWRPKESGTIAWVSHDGYSDKLFDIGDIHSSSDTTMKQIHFADEVVEGWKEVPDIGNLIDSFLEHVNRTIRLRKKRRLNLKDFNNDDDEENLEVRYISDLKRIGEKHRDAAKLVEEQMFALLETLFGTNEDLRAPWIACIKMMIEAIYSVEQNNNW